MAHFNPDDLSRFSEFTIFTTAYKTVSGHQITADVLVPTKLIASSPSTSPSTASQPRPILLRFHGGGFITGSSLFPDFFPKWGLELALRESAVIVSPDYRLMPESSVEDALEDMEDLWTWVHAELPGFIQAKTNRTVAVDTERILNIGESAGGYFSLMLALSHPDAVRAVAGAYPMLDLKDKYFTEAFVKKIFGQEVQFPRSILDEHLEKVRKGELGSIRTADPRLERMPLMMAYIHNGLYKEPFAADNRKLFPFDRLHDGAKFPRGGLFVWHGNEDSVVPASGSIKLKQVIEEVDPQLKFRLALREGEHGFDAETKLGDQWISEGLKDITSAWLA
jgi:acetyl esterase/lipase